MKAYDLADNEDFYLPKNFKMPTVPIVTSVAIYADHDFSNGLSVGGKISAESLTVKAAFKF